MHIFIMDMMNSFGYIGIALLIMIENLFPPIPSEVILTFGGFMTTYTHLTVGGVVFFSTLGSTVGAIFLYYIGKFSGKIRATYRWKARKNPPSQKIRCEKID